MVGNTSGMVGKTSGMVGNTSGMVGNTSGMVRKTSGMVGKTCNLPTSCPCGGKFGIQHNISCKKGGFIYIG